MHLESQERYSAGKALAHPWITRRFQDEIPLSAHEMMQFYEHQQTFRRVMSIRKQIFIEHNHITLDGESSLFFRALD